MVDAVGALVGVSLVSRRKVPMRTLQFFLGSQQQVTVTFKAAESTFPQPQRRLILPVLRKQKCFSKIECGRLHCAKPACEV